jgi:hypothetical protein
MQAIIAMTPASPPQHDRRSPSAEERSVETIQQKLKNLVDELENFKRSTA